LPRVKRTVSARRARPWQDARAGARVRLRLGFTNRDHAAVDLAEPITFTASVSGGSGPSGPEDSFVVDNGASTVSTRGAMLNAWTANVCSSAPADGSLNLIDTSDALAPSDFFLI
jgi:hypothetical protein